MYETEFVRKKKRKIRVAVSTGICSIGVIALGIVAFLGRHVGTFTVKLNTGNVALSLSQTKSFEDPSTYLMINYLPMFEECTYGAILRETHIDNEELHYNDQGPANLDDHGEISSLNYFKYTFYVKNIGNMTAGYDISFNILDNKLSNDKRSLLDTLRVAIYSNVGDSEHEHTVYAKPAAEKHYDDDGNETMKEYIATAKDRATSSKPYYGLAEMFDSENRITNYTVKDFRTDDIIRYTIVCWLEGEDPQSVNYKTAPEGAVVKLGVEINAYENK